MNAFLQGVEAARHVVAALVIVVGVIALAASVIGQIRFPDFFTRLQAAGLAPLAAAITLAGLALEAWDGPLSARLVVLALLILMLGPIRTHLMANAAHAAGLAPRVGAISVHGAPPVIGDNGGAAARRRETAP